MDVFFFFCYTYKYWFIFLLYFLLVSIQAWAFFGSQKASYFMHK